MRTREERGNIECSDFSAESEGIRGFQGSVGKGGILVGPLLWSRHRKQHARSFS